MCVHVCVCEDVTRRMQPNDKSENGNKWHSNESMSNATAAIADWCVRGARGIRHG